MRTSGKSTIAVFFHVFKIFITCMIHYYIHYDTDTFFVSCINKSSELLYSPHVFIHCGIVKYIVTVVSVMSKISVFTTTYPSVNLFVRCSNPNSVYTQVIKIIKFLSKSRNVSTVESTDIFSFAVSFYTTVRCIV